MGSYCSVDMGSFGKMKKVLESNVPVNYTLKNSKNSKSYVMCILSN